MIDVATSDKEIHSLLDQSLHLHASESKPEAANVVEPDVEIEDVLPEICPFFVCRLNEHFESLKILSRNFWDLIKQHHVSSGDLLLFTMEEGGEQHAYFLGTMLRRPLQQILIKAAVEDSQVQFSLKNGRPEILTANELFLFFLQSAPDVGQLKLQVEGWKCQAFLDSRHVLKTNADVQSATFTVTTARLQSSSSKKPRVDLPFGLKMPSKPRKRKAASKKPAKPKASKKAAMFLHSEGVIELSSNSGSEKGNVLSDSSNGNDASDESDGGEIDANKESERVVPVFDIVAIEQQSMQDVAKEIESSDWSREQTAEDIRKNKATPRSSFFSKRLGLDEASIAVSGRSVCLACKKMIPKGSVRFSWFHSCVRPSGWVHSQCLLQHINGSEADTRQHSVDKLKAIIQTLHDSRNASSSSTLRSKPVDSDILATAESIQRALQEGLRS